MIRRQNGGYRRVLKSKKRPRVELEQQGTYPEGLWNSTQGKKGNSRANLQRQERLTQVGQ